MFSISEEVSSKQFVKYLGPAKVLDISKNRKLLLLGIENDSGTIQVWGKAVISSSANFLYGDIVLAAGSDNHIYVLGLLESSSPRSEDKLTASNGAYASLLKNEHEEKIQVYSESGGLVFEYEPVSGKSTVNMQAGDIEFVSKVDMNFISNGNINLKSNQSVQIESLKGIQLSVRNLIEKIQASISIDKTKMKLSSPNLNVISRHAEFHLEFSRYIGNSFSAVIKQSKLIAGKFETVANDVIIRAKNIYKTVDELMQVKIGRMRAIVNSSIHIKSKNSYQYSEEDFKVNAEKIHLG